MCRTQGPVVTGTITHVGCTRSFVSLRHDRPCTVRGCTLTWFITELSALAIFSARFPNASRNFSNATRKLWNVGPIIYYILYQPVWNPDLFLARVTTGVGVNSTLIPIHLPRYWVSSAFRCGTVFLVLSFSSFSRGDQLEHLSQLKLGRDDVGI